MPWVISGPRIDIHQSRIFNTCADTGSNRDEGDHRAAVSRVHSDRYGITIAARAKSVTGSYPPRCQGKQGVYTARVLRQKLPGNSGRGDAATPARERNVNIPPESASLKSTPFEGSFPRRTSVQNRISCARIAYSLLYIPIALIYQRKQ